MKYLVTRIFENDIEDEISVCEDLDSAICTIKNLALSPYFADKFKIYPLSSPLTVRFLDNKIFID